MVRHERWKSGPAKRRYELASKVLGKLEDLADSKAACERMCLELQEIQSEALGDNEFDRTPIIAAILGLFLGVAGAVAVFVPAVRGFGCFVAFTCAFHVLEWTYAAWFHPSDVSEESFLIDHSRAFRLAMASAVIEYWVEWFLFPSLKRSGALMMAAILFVLCCQAMRTGAMWTAASNFHHLVRSQKGDGQRLVKHGIYRIFRHPSYVGWFYWSLGLQVILFNPLNFFGWAFASWRFFNERIEDEERTLVRFFGQEYIDYQKKTFIGIPLIRGYMYQQQRTVGHRPS